MENELQEVNTPIEETQEPVEETVEESNDIPTVDDYEKLKKEAETLRAQKEHWKKKATTIKVEPLKKETNETPSTLTREEAILYAKGYTDEEVDLANKLSKINGTTLSKAIEDDIFKAKYDQRLKQERSEKASLSPSGGSGRFKAEKNPGEMTREEHETYYKKVMGV